MNNFSMDVQTVVKLSGLQSLATHVYILWRSPQWEEVDQDPPISEEVERENFLTYLLVNILRCNERFSAGQFSNTGWLRTLTAVKTRENLVIYRVHFALPVSCKLASGLENSAPLIYEYSEVKLHIHVTEPLLQSQPDFCKVYCLQTVKLIWLVGTFSINSWKWKLWNLCFNKLIWLARISSINSWK